MLDNDTHSSIEAMQVALMRKAGVAKRILLMEWRAIM